MNTKAMVMAIASLLVFPAASTLAKDPIKLQPLDLAEPVRIAKDVVSMSVEKPKDYVVRGTEQFDGWFLQADRLIFESGAHLVFSQTAQSKRNSFFIVAREVIIKDQNKPGMITWERGAITGEPSTVGQAETGTHATADDSGGGAGHTGRQGNPGYPGNNAPSLTLFVKQCPASGLEINFRGQDGGKGGKGQKGGNGGNGAKGHPASQNMFTCTNGAGNGGPGGTGGHGGKGGVGGTGGKGGAVTLVSLTDHLPTLTQRFRVVVTGGLGGPGGDGGVGGGGGNEGPGGEQALPWCQGNGSDGSPGPAGGNGPSGDPGMMGIEGDMFLGAIPEQKLNEIILWQWEFLNPVPSPTFQRTCSTA